MNAVEALPSPSSRWDSCCRQKDNRPGRRNRAAEVEIINAHGNAAKGITNASPVEWCGTHDAEEVIAEGGR